MTEAAARRDNTNIGRYQRTEEHRSALRLSMYEKLESGKLVVRHDTKPELAFAEQMDKLGISYKKQFVIQFGRIGIDRFRHAYDFHLLDTNILVEIDGDYWHSKPGAVERDSECDRVASDRGYHVIRIRTSNLKQSLEMLVASTKETK
jgi:G:T-mismatch repair DNA endonuclease (very short patch repair protein)